MEKASITLNGYQLRCALDFVAPDLNPPKLTMYDKFKRALWRLRRPHWRHTHDEFLASELESELSFAQFEACPDPEGGEEMPAGIYCWFTEYPEEGRLHLPESEPI